MAIIVRKTVHYDHGTVTSIKQEPLFITFTVALWTKNTAVGPVAQAVVQSPRRP